MWLAWSVISSPSPDPFRRRVSKDVGRIAGPSLLSPPQFVFRPQATPARPIAGCHSNRRIGEKHAVLLVGVALRDRSQSGWAVQPSVNLASMMAADEPLCGAEIFGTIAPDQPVQLAHSREREAGIAGAGADVA